MNTFGNMKDLYKMQKEAKEMQKKLRKQIVSGESKDGSVKVYMNAAKEFENIEIDDSLMDPDMKELLKKRMAEAFKNLEKRLQKEMAKSFDMDDLKGMLGN
jgi:DNA-binding YbaB/EbfC family protein